MQYIILHFNIDFAIFGIYSMGVDKNKHVLKGELLPDRTYVVDFDEHDELTIRVK